MKTKVNSHVKVAMCLAAAGAFGIGTLQAQLVSDGATATVNATSTNLAGNLIVGTNGSFTTLIVTNAGSVTNSGNGVIGQANTARTNRVVVTGSGSTWSMVGNLNLGAMGSAGQLIVTNGGRVHNNFGNLALNGGSSNVAIVSGLNSLWTNRGSVNIGNAGTFNRVLISNNAVVGVSGGVTIGNASASSNLLWVAGGGVLRSDGGSLGVNGVVRGNVAVITDPGSSWTSSSFLAVGQTGEYNQLYVTNGGKVFSSGAYVGANGLSGSGQTNLAVLAGAGSAWTNTATAVIGNIGSFNQLIISNGATMRHSTAANLTLGVMASSSNNTMVVSGPGALFSNRGITAQFIVGAGGSFNKASVMGGGVVETDSVIVGQSGSNNQLVVSNSGALYATSLTLGVFPDVLNNSVSVAGGTLIVTNSSGDGTTLLRGGGAISLISGLFRTDVLRATNSLVSGVGFVGGTLQTRSTTFANNSVFQVGDGVAAATLELLATGIHSFADGLRIAASSVLKGSGTIVGAVTNSSGGIISPGASVGKLILSNSPSLQGSVLMEVSRNGISLTNDQIQVLSNLTFAGTLTVIDIGPDALGLGDQFKLFDAPSFTGSFANVSLPALASGLAWTNKLSVDGSIEVVAGPVPTLVVTNLASFGPGTLRQALTENQTLGGGYTIVFSNNLVGIITLSGELSINAPVTIRGPGTNVIAVNGNNLNRIFTVAAGPTFISDLTIRNGRVAGADGNQMQNGQHAFGGAVWNASTLTLSNCLVISNTVVGGNGGPSGMGNVGNGGRAYGGAVYNNGGTLTLLASVFARNRAQGGAGGNASGGGGTTVGFGGEAYGGAIASEIGTNRSVRCDFFGNTALGGAGGIAGGSNPGGTGGPAYGGGLYNIGNASIAASTFRDGLATGGSSTFGGFTGSSFGGAVANLSSLVVHSSTIVSNQASGASVNDWGGGIYNGSDLALTNCTVAWNQADAGGGLRGAAFIGNTIVAGNSAGSGPDIEGTVTSLDYNLIQSTAGATIVGVTAHNLTGVNPLLGPLENQLGGPSVLPLLVGSPAIDQGKSFGLPVDQRGVVRPYDLASVVNAAGGDGTDIGAFEFLPVPQLNIARASGDAVVLFWTTDAAAFTLQSTTELTAPNWLPVTNQPLIVGSMVYVTNATSPFQRSYRLKWP